MVEAGTLCGQADVAKFAGENASATSVAEAYTNVYIKMAEGFVCASSRYNWVGDYASVSTIGKELLREVTAARAAIMVISYDMSGYTSKEEAQTMVDVLWSIFVDGIQLLRFENFRNFVLNGEVA